MMPALSSGTPSRWRDRRSLVFSLPSSCRRRIAAAVKGFVIEPRLKTESGRIGTPASRSARPYPFSRTVSPPFTTARPPE